MCWISRRVRKPVPESETSSPSTPSIPRSIYRFSKSVLAWEIETGTPRAFGGDATRRARYQRPFVLCRLNVRSLTYSRQPCSRTTNIANCRTAPVGANEVPAARRRVRRDLSECSDDPRKPTGPTGSAPAAGNTDQRSPAMTGSEAQNTPVSTPGVLRDHQARLRQFSTSRGHPVSGGTPTSGL